MLPDSGAAEPLRQALGRLETSPITGIHLWFDRQITDLDHAVLLDRTIQWMFHKSKLLSARPTNGRRQPDRGGGARRRTAAMSSWWSVRRSLWSTSPANEIIELALAELREFFPGARSANLVKATVIKEVHATYSPGPGVDPYRPKPETVWPRVFLAGDWTATGWPATMEGAVRSGYTAAQCVARVGGIRDAAFLVPDLPAAGFMRAVWLRQLRGCLLRPAPRRTSRNLRRFHGPRVARGDPYDLIRYDLIRSHFLAARCGGAALETFAC